ncbi:MAG TPA: ABC transporter permease subunit [Stellaceae bacterium]|nr:ABC transporter permease subunit [Stellaceae bacterium]
MRPILAVFRKEMIDHLRDKRSILVAMIYPLLGPVLLGIMIGVVGGSMRVGGSAPLVIPVVNAAAAPDLVRFFAQHGATVRPLSAEPRALVSGGGASFALILPERPHSSGQGALRVRLITNPTRVDSIVATGRVIGMLNEYQQETLRGRLSAAGLSPEVMNVLSIEQERVGQAAGPAVILLAMIPPFIIFTLFTGGVHVALDSTCGERERGSFEPLMMNPVTRVQVLIGKLGATIVFTLMAVGVQAIAFWVMLRLVPRESLGLVSPPGTLRFILIVSVCLPLIVLAAATQLLISAVTRSMKEAQTYLGLLPLIPGIAGMVLAFAPVGARPLLAVIPTFGQTLLMGQLVRSEAISAMFVGITAVATLGVTALLLALGFRLYEREAILFPH